MFKVKKLLISSAEKNLVDISFEIKDAFALVGQSGSGKSLTLKALLGMTPPNLKTSLEIEADFELERGKGVSIVVQNPFTALSPLSKIKDQFLISEDEAKKFLSLVELDEDFLYRYPSELSGGQLQRVIVAMAISHKPKLLLLDEPTTALDSKTKESIIKLIQELQSKIGYKILFVTHDIALSRLLCSEIAILKDGLIVEQGKVDEVLDNPSHPYTRSLISSNFKNRLKRV